ncbi:MAG: DNA replication/repair protein RecF [Geminicoccaceae bacterium]|nr:DNA replication/repair protein RecF [Geminicoccaceae bacterium]
MQPPPTVDRRDAPRTTGFGTITSGRSAATTAAVTSLRLTDFRNYRRLEIRPAGGPVVLTGANGAGKTNLLESLSLLAPGRGFRRAALTDLDRDGGGPWRMEVEVAAADGPLVLRSGRDPASDKRSIHLFDQPLRTQGVLSGLFGVGWLVPSMDRLFDEASSGRRRFLDRLVPAVQPDHATRVAAYERAMRERAAVLREGAGDAVWLSALERRMAEPAVAIAAARLELVAALNTQLETPSIDLPRVRLAVAGEVEAALGTLSARDVEQRLRADLAASRARDSALGGAAHGTHRSDLAVRDAERDEAAARCSTGRQKAMLLAIVLAEARLRRACTGQAPVLLLDEVAAHLDARKRTGLCATLIELGVQAWLTGTDRSLFEALEGRAQFYSVDEGRLRDHD